MARVLQNAGTIGTKVTSIRNYQAGSVPNAKVSTFSTAPAPKAVDRSKNCAGTTKSGKPCGAFHTEGSLYCVNHEPQEEVTDATVSDS